MRIIKLTKGKETIVDDANFEWLNQYNWQVDSDGYAVRYRLKSDTTPGCKVRMARQIMNTPKGVQVDHINRDKLDNRQSNLRNCTNSENNKNKRPIGKSGYRGVCWHKLEKRWQVSLRINGKKKYFGYHDDIKKAALLYDEMAKRYHGEFAYLNFRSE